MGTKLSGKRVAVVATDGFEQSELVGPMRALLDEGATCDVIAPKDGKIKGWKHIKWGDEIDVDINIKDADAGMYDALVLPGGVMSPDILRSNPLVRDFVRAFFDSGKTIGAICHGPWTLIDADCVDGRTMTSWPSLRTDLINAGAHWVDQDVVVDEGLITSRKPEDLPAFNRELIAEIAESVQEDSPTLRRIRSAAVPSP